MALSYAVLFVSVVSVVGTRLRLHVLVPMTFTMVALERGLLMISIRRCTPLCSVVRLMTVRVGHCCRVVPQPVPFRLEEKLYLCAVSKATVFTAVLSRDRHGILGIHGEMTYDAPMTPLGSAPHIPYI